MMAGENLAMDNPTDLETRPDCAVIALHGVTREYEGHGGVVRALDHASFSIVAGEWVAMTGPSVRARARWSI